MTNNASNYVFVYGSLRRGFHSPAYQYISNYFNLFGEAKVKGKLFDTGEYPAAIPVLEDSFIKGELYLIKNENEFSWAIAQLDDYEGVIVEKDEQPLYRREIVDVYINDEIVPAWIYWYNGDLTGKPVISSGDILDYLKKK
ncbi:gamma-glutamylcyclotransferase family protein [Terrimonas pollutisoli]|uniref:gamma-glutamylcyclotransferase family protein n=1 Tax=Terrimonas pollutisoli TaxID=3034147 RepID=UPI0023EC49C1|nr:gamma-glutamylcyclotransferase family protein [Terrimonas sp. H1YJ31]